jgi:DNA mismatch repair protein MSH6
LVNPFRNYLIFLDELGRGTSTFDGYAIAYAVLYHLVSKVGCLGLFSTHYGTLTNEFESHPLVSLKYMDFLVDQDSQQVTFLYKLTDGKCPQSYGMNVARMARIPETIIENAEKMAQDFDENHSFKTAGEGVVIDLLTLANFHSLATNEENSKRVFQSL